MVVAAAEQTLHKRQKQQGGLQEHSQQEQPIICGQWHPYHRFTIAPDWLSISAFAA
jgi:hypothetical protein